MLSKNDELFLTVAKSESISKAAEQLYISQPSLTKRMQQLEAQLGVALFDHKSRPLKLSPAGELYYEYLTRSAVQEHALLLDLREAAEGRRGKLSVGAPANLAQSLFPAILPSFCRTFPNVSLSVVEATGAEIQTLIAGRQLDMAFFLRLRISFQRELRLDIFDGIGYTTDKTKLGSPERRRKP